MADFNTSKVDGDTVAAAEWNQLASLDNLITTSGQTPSTGNLNQMGIGSARYSSGGQFFTDSGAVDSYVLSPVSPFKAPVSATEGYFVGMTIKFRAGNAGTGGAAIVNVNGAGVKSLKAADGTTNPSSIPTTEDTEWRYDGTVFRKVNAVVNATESEAGIAEIATQAETNTGTDDTRFITPLKLANATSIIKLGTPVSASGTSVDFTGIPAGTKKIEIMFAGLSTNGTSVPMIQLGDSGGIEATGYLGSVSYVGASSASESDNFTTGYHLAVDTGAAIVMHGILTLTLLNASTNTWIASGINGRSDQDRTDQLGGSKSLSAVLDRVRITTFNGTDTFDAGTINIQYQ